MTAVVGLVDVRAGRVWMGADSAGVSGWSLTIRADTKIFAKPPYLIGFTTSYRMGQILRHATTLPAPPADVNIDQFMCTRFVDEVRASLRSAGWAERHDEREQGGTFLVGVAGHLFRVDSDYQVARAAALYDAIGCGSDVALGSLHATRGRPARNRLQLALEASELHSAGVRGPFTIIRGES